MTSLEIRALGLAVIVLSLVVALAVVATAAALVALVRHIHAKRTRRIHPVPAPEAECPGLKEAA
jgi:hypothetical protein